MDKLKLIDLIEKGFTHKKIAKELNCSPTNVRYWLQKYNLKSKNFKIGQKEFFLTNNFLNMKRLGSDRDFLEIQKLYDSGLSWREVSKIAKISCKTIYDKIKNKQLKSRSLSDSIKLNKKKNPIKHSDETRKKISEARKKHLKENGGNPWAYKNMVNTSPSCENFKQFLKSKGIEFEEEHMPLKHKNRFFSIDIAFPDKKIGIEINGNQHYNSDHSLKTYYQERHDLIVAEGWILFEIPSKRCFSEESMNQLLKELCLK